MFAITRTLRIAHWYSSADLRRKFRYMRDKRYHPNTLANTVAKNKYSKQIHFKTNRWNYKRAYRDM